MHQTRYWVAIKGKGIVVFVDKIEISNEYFLHVLAALGIYWP
jgi:hypothetical protein